MTATFTVLPGSLEKIEGTAMSFKLSGPLVAKINDPVTSSICYVRVPKGFVTDFSTCPAPFRILIGPAGRYWYAAFVYQYLVGEGYLPAFAREVTSICLDDLDIGKWRRRAVTTWLYLMDNL